MQPLVKPTYGFAGYSLMLKHSASVSESSNKSHDLIGAHRSDCWMRNWWAWRLSLKGFTRSFSQIQPINANDQHARRKLAPSTPASLEPVLEELVCVGQWTRTRARCISRTRTSPVSDTSAIAVVIVSGKVTLKIGRYRRTIKAVRFADLVEFFGDGQDNFYALLFYYLLLGCALNAKGLAHIYLALPLEYSTTCIPSCSSHFHLNTQNY
jgi:hypothetical protein